MTITLHLVCAITFIYVLSPLIPLTVSRKPLHRTLGVIYMILQVILVATGFSLSNVAYHLRGGNIHFLIRVIFSNLAILFFSLNAVVPILIGTNPDLTKRLLRLSSIVSIVILLMGLSLLVFGFTATFIIPSTNLAVRLFTFLGFHPSLVVLGIILSWISWQQVRWANGSLQSRSQNIQLHRHLMAVSLILSLANPITEEINSLNVQNNEIVFLIAIVVAILVYLIYPYYLKRQKVGTPDWGLSGFIFLFVIGYSLYFYSLYRSSKLPVVYQLSSYTPHEKRKANLSGCENILKLLLLKSEPPLFFMLKKCDSFRALKRRFNDPIAEKIGEENGARFGLVLGVGQNLKNVPIPFVSQRVILIYKTETAALNANMEITLSNFGCPLWLQITMVKYKALSFPPDQIEIFRCTLANHEEYNRIDSYINQLSQDGIRTYTTKVVQLKIRP